MNETTKLGSDQLEFECDETLGNQFKCLKQWDMPVFDRYRLKMQSFLSKYQSYLILREIATGRHERDILIIVDRWAQYKGYTKTSKEKNVWLKGKVTSAGMCAFGLAMPLGPLIFPQFRHLCIGTKLRIATFAGLSYILAYSNFMSAHPKQLKNLFKLHDSPLAYVAFHMFRFFFFKGNILKFMSFSFFLFFFFFRMCQPQYSKFRGKWQSEYNLSSIAYRYSDFDLREALIKANATSI